MPSSDAMTIPHVLKLVKSIGPNSILDIGCGNGKYGFLFRELLDMNYGRMNPSEWHVRIDGMEIMEKYRSPLHDYFYDAVFWGNWMDIKPNPIYDVVFMGDVLEHFPEGEWQKALDKALHSGSIVITVCPNWDGSINQGAVFGNESERHRVVLSPSQIGGKCVWANTKAFICVKSLGKINIPRDLLL